MIKFMQIISFAYTELAENINKKIVISDFTNDLPEVVEDLADVHSQQV